MIPMRLGLARGEPLADGGPVAVPRLRQWPCHRLPSLCYEPRGARLGDGTPRPCCLAAGNQIFPFFWCVFGAWKKWSAGTQKILTLSSNVKTTSQSSARFPSWFLSENRWFFWLSKPELNFNNCDCPVVIFCPDGMAICCWHFLRGRCFVRFSFHRGAARKKNSWSSPGRGWRVICGTWQARFIAVECDRHQNQKEHIASAYLTVRHGIDGPFIDGLMFTY